MGQTETSPNFQVINEKLGDLNVIKLVNNTSNEYVSVLPEKGGMLFSMVLNFNNSPVEILDRYKSEAELLDNLTGNYKGCNLFPFPNRIDAGKYTNNGKEHQLNVNFVDENNAIHGLVVEKPFLSVNQEQENEYCCVELTYASDNSLIGYPYKFEYSIIYKLDNNGLTIKNSATNKETSESIPVGFGYHPYFKFDTKADDLILEFPSKDSFDVNDRMLPNGKTQDFTKFNTPIAIGSFNFDTCFSYSPTNEVAEAKIIAPELNGGISVWQKTGENGLNFVQIYIPPERKSIAIEPMTCIANAFNNKIGLITLKPEETQSVVWGIKKI